MAFPTTSFIFRQFLVDRFEGTLNYDLDTDTMNGALMNNNVSGTKDDAAPAYNSTGWTSATEEVSDAGGWAAGGRALDAPSASAANIITAPSSGVVMFDMADEVSGTLSTGLTNVYGWMVYDDTLAGNNAVCGNYFGGANSASAGGTFTVVISANGLFRITV